MTEKYRDFADYLMTLSEQQKYVTIFYLFENINTKKLKDNIVEELKRRTE